MKHLVAIIFVFALANLPAVSWAQECTIACMICPEVADASQYAVGAMKSMKSITPGQDKWLFRSEVDLANTFGIPKKYEPGLKRLIKAFKDQGTQIVFIMQPTRGLMAWDKVLPEHGYGFNVVQARASFLAYAKQLRKLGAVVPDLSGLIESPPVDYFFRRDHHWTPQGARVTAKWIAQYMEDNNLLDQLDSIEFITEPSLIIPKNGTMNRALNEICGNNYGFQYIQGYQTYQAMDSDASIFGDDDVEPSAVLVGTSNSAVRDDDFRNYNFEGFLKDALNIDMINYALAGGGQEGALLQYLLSEDYLPDKAPAYIFWELPVSYDLADEKIPRQLIPAVKGGCAATEMVLSRHTQWDNKIPKDTRIEILSNTGSDRKEIIASDYFLELELSNKNIKDFYAIVYYDNGRRDKVWFRRYDIVEGGRYYMEFTKDPKLTHENILSVFLQPSEDYANGTSIEAKICKSL